MKCSLLRLVEMFCSGRSRLLEECNVFLPSKLRAPIRARSLRGTGMVGTLPSVHKNAKPEWTFWRVAGCIRESRHPSSKRRWVTAPKVFIDQLLWGPFWNAVYICFLGALKKDSPDAVKKAVVSTAIPLVLAGIRLWPLAHVVTYGL